jgi:hypothetical protein
MTASEETPPSPPDYPPPVAPAVAHDVGDTDNTTPPQRNHKHAGASESDEAIATPVVNVKLNKESAEAVPVLTASPTSVQDIRSHEEIKQDANDKLASMTAAPTTKTIRSSSTSPTASPKTTAETIRSKSASPTSTSTTTNTKEQHTKPQNSNNGNSKLHALADTVRQLTEQVHARDRQIRGVKEKWSRCADLELELAGKQCLLEDTVAHNEGLIEIVRDLNVQLATREHVQFQSQPTSAATTNTTTTTNITSVNSANPMHEHPLKQERDHTLIQAGELSMKLADTRAMEDELRDELEDALATIKQHYNQQNQNQSPYNRNGNMKYPAMHGLPTAPQSQSQSKATPHTATYQAVAANFKTTINNSHYNSPGSPSHSFWWPGRHQAAPKQSKSPPNSPPPIPSWMSEILDQNESIEDESDSERSGSFPAHVTVHKKAVTATANTGTGAHTCNASLDTDTNELPPPSEDLADVELPDAMDDGFAL